MIRVTHLATPSIKNLRQLSINQVPGHESGHSLDVLLGLPAPVVMQGQVLGVPLFGQGQTEVDNTSVKMDQSKLVTDHW